MFHGKVAVVVDDSASIRREVKAILEKQGMTVRIAGSEFGMFNSIEEYGKKADLIIMDLNLNNEHGFDLISKLKNTSRYNDINVLVLTQYADLDNVKQAKNLGVEAYLRKPIDAKELSTKIKSIFEKQVQSKEN
ncbi:response regulator [Herbivorax sp. ANBcel31]|uniref:response regulator n=1 Tax=Herbivorax sp. ANBcel31 TaxID=3069754 RepID=UPI0027B40DA5|nr:response regulator [Herbivorax sp. ANBcel31]MDQ2084921.1 response regulator [Herbivorax sp. ANBcel31]